MLRASIFALIALFLIIGCEEDSNPVTPEPTSIYNIQLTGLPESVTAPGGAERYLPFQITVINNSTNEVVSGASVNLAVPVGGGTITPTSATADANGNVEALYSFDMPTGESTATIFIIADKQSNIATIDLFGTERPVNLVLTSSESQLFPEGGEDAVVDMIAVVTDERGVGIQGIQVYYELLFANQANAFGSLTPISETDEDGLASTTFHSLGGHGEVHIRCTVHEGVDFDDIQDELTIEIIAPMSGGIMLLNSDMDFIYADGGYSQATVRAVLKDSSNQALADQEIIFTANNNGTIMSPIVTDNFGIAFTTFSDVGVPSMNALGERTPCVVRAICERLNIETSITIDIRPVDNVDNIILAAGKATMGAGSGDSTWVRATCYLNEERTISATPGTLVNFEVSEGMGSFRSPQVTVRNGGVAENVYIAGNPIGQARLKAFVWEDINGGRNINSNEVYINLIPGTPANITVSSSPTVLRIGEVGEQSMVIATVTDSFGNPVRDGSVLVQFSTTLGTIDPPSNHTDTGRSIAMLRPGIEAGMSIVTASVFTPHGEITAQTAVLFISGGGNSIELSADPLLVPIRSYCTLRAVVRDANGNLVEIPTAVGFEWITHYPPPEGGNFNNNTPYYADTTSTSNGVVTATFHTGNRTGPELFRAFLLDNEGQPTGVQATISLTVVGGPPAIISMGYEENARDVGGGSWEILISAQVMDEHRNRVLDGTAVNFRADPVGSIGHQAVTDNGVAIIDLTYQSENTFEEITVTAYLLTEDDSIGTEFTFPLPLQRGELELHLDPDNAMVDDHDEIHEFRVWGILRDGHGVTINNAPILFSSTRAEYYYDRGGINRPNFEQFAPDPVRRLTGPGNDGETNNERFQDIDPEGHAVVWLIGSQDDFYLDPFTLEVRVQLEAHVEGYDDVFSDPVFLFITRHG